MKGYILIKAPGKWRELVDLFRNDRRVVHASVVFTPENVPNMNYDIVLEVDGSASYLRQLLAQVRQNDVVTEAILFFIWSELSL